MATPKNSAKPLGYENTPHNGVYLTYAYAPALSPANKAVFCWEYWLAHKICGIGFFKKCMLHDILNKKFKHL